MKLIDINLRLVGSTPLLLHNSQMANPNNTFVKAISELTAKKKGKSIAEEDFHSEKERLQFLGSLYWDDDLGIYMPGFNVLRCLMEGGTMTRLGTKLEQAVVDYTDKCHVDPYTGKYDHAQDLFDEGHFLTTVVKIGQASVLSTRAQFVKWTVPVSFTIDTEVMDESSFIQCAEAAGRFKGLGDGRKKGYGKGRFAVEVQ